MKFRDVELLSSYLDGQTSPSDSARLKTRLASDPALASTLDALRESRSLLRRLPHRRAPRNFLLTPKMVGRRPPLPRSYPVFRFATALATILFALSFLNLRPVTFGASAPAPSDYGLGGGAEVAATEAPVVATEPPMVQMAPAVTEPPVPTPTMEPGSGYTALPTSQPPAPAPTMESAAIAPTAAPEPAADQQNRAAEEPASQKTAGEPEPVPAPQPLLTAWQMGLGLLALLCAASMFAIRRLAANKWREK